MIEKGVFITFEGVEGAGKTTQMTLARDFLITRGLETLVLREPGGTPIGDRIRELLLSPSPEPLEPLAEFFLFCASRHQLVQTLIRPALERGCVVLCDRFRDSSLAYQGYARGLPINTIEQLTEVATGGLAPDLTIWLDLPVEEGLSRVRARPGDVDDRFQSERLGFHHRVREGFATLARNEPHRIRAVPADGPQGAIAATIRRLIEHELSEHHRAQTPM